MAIFETAVIATKAEEAAIREGQVGALRAHGLKATTMGGKDAPRAGAVLMGRLSGTLMQGSRDDQAPQRFEVLETWVDLFEASSFRGVNPFLVATAQARNFLLCRRPVGRGREWIVLATPRVCLSEWAAHFADCEHWHSDDQVWLCSSDGDAPIKHRVPVPEAACTWIRVAWLELAAHKVSLQIARLHGS
jgi:hypothetical protein